MIKKKKTVKKISSDIKTISISDLLIIKDTIKKCGGYNRFKAIVMLYSRVFGNPKRKA